MKPIRQGPFNRGPFKGATPTEAQPNAYPKAIWVTLVVVKRQTLGKRLRTSEQLFDVRRFPVVVSKRSKPIKVVGLVEFRRDRPKYSSKFIKVRKFPTVVVTSRSKPTRIVSLTEFKRNRPLYSSRFIKVRKFPVVVTTPRTQAIKIASLTEFRRNKPKTTTKFSKVFGYVTSNRAFASPVVVLSAVNKRLVLSNRQKTKTKFLDSFGAATVVVVRVKPIKRVSLNSLPRPRPRTKVQLVRKFGKTTTRTKVKGPVVLKFATQQTVRKKRFVLGKFELIAIPRNFGVSPVGSVVQFYDGINVANGLGYHLGLSRPHLILIANGDGTFTIVKDVSLTDLKADSVLKETYLIDGNLP